MINIRKLKSDNIEQVYDIGKNVQEFKVSDSGVFWSKKQLEEWSKSNSDVILVAEDANKIIGFIFFGYHVPTTKATLENIWVDSVYRKTGLARKLYDEGVSRIKKIGCKYIVGYVSESNMNARDVLDPFHCTPILLARL